MKQLHRRLSRFGNRPPSQPLHHNPLHHPLLASSRCGGCSGVGLAARACVAVALVVTYLNYTIVPSKVGRAAAAAGTGNISDNNVSKGSGRADRAGATTAERRPLLPPFPDVRYPPLDVDLSRPLVREWDLWAQEPMLGSYNLPPPSSSSASRRQQQLHLHLPSFDLEASGPEGVGEVVGSRLRAGTPDAPPAVRPNWASPDHVVLTRRGDKDSQGGGTAPHHRQPNQDRVSLITVASREGNGKDDSGGGSRNRPSSGPSDGDWWIGLFDGHGPYGHTVAQYSSTEFARRVAQEWDTTTATATTTTAALTDPDTLKRIFLDVHRSMPHLDGSGCTGISIVKRGRQLVVSNVGDSLAFVVRYGRGPGSDGTSASVASVDVEIVYQTEPHKPDSPAERKRIEDTGGTVQDPPYPGLSARLLIPSPDGITVMALAMSRSLGDHDGEPYGLLAEPATDVLDLDKFDRDRKGGGAGAAARTQVEYLVVACTDGMVDKVSPQEVAEELATAFGSGRREAPLEAAERLIRKSSDLWRSDGMEPQYRDDISIVAHRLVLPKQSG